MPNILPFQRKSSTHNYEQMVEKMPVAVMTCRISDFKIDYINKHSYELLKKIRHVLATAPEEMLGSSINVFYKDPEYQRQLLKNPRNLPHIDTIQVGDEILELNISAVLDERGNYTHAMLTWNVISDKIVKDQDMAHLMHMMDDMPVNVMSLDIHNDFKINYINQTSIDTLTRMQDHLPIKAGELLGTPIKLFHEDLGHQTDMWRDPSNLPTSANIRLGPEVLKVQVTAINDAQGHYIGPVLTWSTITDNVEIAETVSGLVNKMADKASSMDESFNNMLTLAKTTEELSVSVSSAAEELNVTVKEIAAQVNNSSVKAQNAAQQAQDTDQLVNSLDEAATAIGGVVEVIEEIAEKTNLLALNATIEAARAGEYGKGFAVVASEVKDLANQTTRSTQEIRGQIHAMQEIVKGTVSAIGEISGVMNELSDAFSSISAAVEEQSITMSTVSRDIGGVQDASVNTGEAAEQVKQVATDLNQYSTELNSKMEDYLAKTS